MKLKITMKDGIQYELPLNQSTEITFKYDRIQFTQYYERGDRAYAGRDVIYYEDIYDWEWI